MWGVRGRCRPFRCDLVSLLLLPLLLQLLAAAAIFHACRC